MHKPFLSFTVLCLLCFAAATAQTKAPFSATVDRDKILIGEQFDWILDARFPANTPLYFFEIDTLPHFEVIAKSKIDTATVGNEILLSQRITLTSWDSGRWQLPALAMANSSIKTTAIPITISFSPFDPKQDYHDVKDIADAKQAKEQNWLWYAIAASVVALLLIIFLLRRKKPVVENKLDVNAYKKALADLEKLKKEGMAAKDAKTYYVALVDIFRTYLQKGKGISSFSKTSDDLILQLKTLQLPSDVSAKLFQVLRLSDAVKFAKLIPSDAENNQSLIIIEKSVEAIENK